MYGGGMRLQLTPKPSSKSPTPVTLLSDRHWGRLNLTLLTDSISLAYMCPCLWNTAEHYQSCSSVVFIDSILSGFDPRSNWIRYCDSELHPTEYYYTDNRSVNSLRLRNSTFHYLFTSPALNPILDQLKPIHLLRCISISHLHTSCYILCPSQL
jgi:hypothetical protein